MHILRFVNSSFSDVRSTTDEGKPASKPSYLTWANIKKALHEMFTLKDKKNNIPGDVSKGEEQGDDSENADTQCATKQDVIQDEVAEDRRLEEAANEIPGQERVPENNEFSTDDVPPVDDQTLSEELQEVQSDSNAEPEHEKSLVNEADNAPEETLELTDDVEPAAVSGSELGNTNETEADLEEAMEDETSGPSDEEPTELVDKAEDENSGDIEDVLEENVLAEEDSAADEEFQDWGNTTELEIVPEDEEVGPETNTEESDEPTDEPHTEHIGLDPEGDTLSQQKGYLEKAVDATSNSERIEVNCREADEVRPDAGQRVVKRHSSVQVLENVPGRPLVCTACGAYIFVNIKGVL